MPAWRRLLGAIGLAALLPAAAAHPGTLLDFTPGETRQILRHGPWPMPWAGDPSNRVSGHPDAVALGRRLFHDPRLSANGRVACTSCHDPKRGFADGRALSHGLAAVERNAPGLLDVRLNHWFGWDGAHDTLWGQSIRPLLHAAEFGGTAASVAAVVRGDAELACRYARAFGEPVPANDETVLVAVGKALAAFQETLVSGRTPFDEFRDALEAGDRAAAARYPPAAQRGLRVFLGEGRCAACHLGPRFTNGEFHDVGVPFFVARGRVDPGRHGGIRALADGRYGLLGPFSDDPDRRTATRSRHVVLLHRNWGEFRVPTLRNVARTAPYMHNGSVPTLTDVVRHYAEIDERRLHADGERLLRPFPLDAAARADLVAFLDSLTAPPPAPDPPTRPPACAGPG